MEFFCFFLQKQPFLNLFYVFSTNARLLRFCIGTIPWKHEICIIRGPPVSIYSPCFEAVLQYNYRKIENVLSIHAFNTIQALKISEVIRYCVLGLIVSKSLKEAKNYVFR